MSADEYVECPACHGLEKQLGNSETREGDSGWRLKCTQCECIISVCVSCGKQFQNGEEIDCLGDGTAHRCSDCRK